MTLVYAGMKGIGDTTRVNWLPELAGDCAGVVSESFPVGESSLEGELPEDGVLPWLGGVMLWLGGVLPWLGGGLP